MKTLLLITIIIMLAGCASDPLPEGEAKTTEVNEVLYIGRLPREATNIYSHGDGWYEFTLKTSEGKTCRFLYHQDTHSPGNHGGMAVEGLTLLHC